MSENVEQEARLRACRAELEEVLQKYNCRLEPAFTIDHTGVRRTAKIVPNEEKQNEK